jgi:hypothetical protein
MVKTEQTTSTGKAHKSRIGFLRENSLGSNPGFNCFGGID